MLAKIWWKIISIIRFPLVFMGYFNICGSLLVSIYIVKLLHYLSMKFLNFDLKEKINWKNFW